MHTNTHSLDRIQINDKASLQLKARRLPVVNAPPEINSKLSVHVKPAKSKSLYTSECTDH